MARKLEDYFQTSDALHSNGRLEDMKHTNWTRFFSVVPATLMALVMVAFTGCSTDTNMAAPEGPLTFAPGDVPFVHGTAEQGASLGNSGTWQLIASQLVQPGVQTDVEADRFKLDFDTGSLSQAETIEIWNRDPNTIDVQFGPHGTNFGVPVELTIDFSGTNCDPDSPNYDGSTAKFFYFDPALELWVEIAGVSETADKEYIVVLEHFSRYALFGTPGW